MKSGLAVFGLIFCLSGCSGFGMKMKSLVSGKSEAELKGASAGAMSPSSRAKSFNQSSSEPYRVPLKYKRMTANKMERESKLHESNSLWINEGQTSYLFSQNQVRRQGDILNVQLDGAPLDGLETKANVIRKMLKRMERKSRRVARAPKGNAAAENSAGQQQNQQAQQNGAAGNSQGQKKTDKNLPVEVVPTRIVERLVDGNYRVKGAQPFMIGKREFKVIVAGIVRGEDFNDEGLPASRLLDPKFDIVSVRGVQ